MKRKSESAQDSSGRQKRPSSALIENPKPWDWSGNLVRSSRLTEEVVRRVVREELVLAMHHFTGQVREELELAMSHLAKYIQRDNAKSTEENDVRNLRLQIQTKVSNFLFTGQKLEGEGGGRIFVALINANTGDVVRSGLESSIKLDVVVLDGNFQKDDEDDWTQEEFESHVVKQREGKRPILAGDLVVKLKEGVGEIGELFFTDNSSWNRSKRFRIGLKVATGFCGKTRIREAITDAFTVKEHRGEAYMKHHPPASDDEVWRLENIAKDGKSHQKLSDAGIYKVEDFLLQLFLDPEKLRDILGKSMSEKRWDSLIHHAKTCKTKWKLYLDYPDGVTKHGVVFNTDDQPIGLVKDREYLASHRLSALEKEHVDTIVKKALDNWNDVREVNGETFSGILQKKSHISFPSQVFEGQIESPNPVQCNLAPPFCVTPFGPAAPLTSVNSNAEGHGGATASALPLQLQNTNFGNAMKLWVDESDHMAAQQPISTGPLNVLISQGDIHSSSQMHHAVNENAPPEGNHLRKNLPPFVSDDLDKSLAFLSQSSPHNGELFKTHGGSVSGTSKGVNGWVKIRAVIQWCFVIRKIVTKRRGIMVQPPIEVQP